MAKAPRPTPAPSVLPTTTSLVGDLRRVLDLAAASWLASANYLGYLVGALLCMLQPWFWTRFPSLPSLAFSQLVRGGLLMTGVLTLAMGWLEAPAWPLLRFLAGVTSGVVFVYTSGW